LLFDFVKKRIIDEICKTKFKEVAGIDSVDDLINEVSAELEKIPSKNESRINVMQLTIKRIAENDDTALG
jgi:hypothetical protein